MKETVVQACSVKKVFVEISQNSQENTFSYRTLLVAAFGKRHGNLKIDWNANGTLLQNNTQINDKRKIVPLFRELIISFYRRN